MILLIGATGFLGLSILERLLKEDYKVGCLLRPGSNIGTLEKTASTVGKNILLICGEFLDPDSIRSQIGNSVAAVYMIDLANTPILQNFLNAVKGTSLKRIIFISSTTVLVPLESAVKDSKLKSEELIKRSGLKYTILRPSMTYGISNDPNFSKMLKFIKKWGFFITFGNGENLIQPVYIEDIAGAVVKVLKEDAAIRKTYNLPGKSPLKYNKMLKIVKENTNRNFKVIKLPPGPSRKLIMVYNILSKNPSITTEQIDRMSIDKVYDYTEAKNDFGFSPVSFKNGIKKLIKTIDL